LDGLGILKRNRWLYYSILSVVTLVIYRLALDTAYVRFIVPYFESTGFFIDYSVDKVLISWLLMLISGGVVITYCWFRTGPSRLVVALYFIGVIVPMMTLYAYQSRPFGFTAMCSTCISIQCILCFLLPKVSVRYPSKRVSQCFLWCIVIPIALYVYGFLIGNGALWRFNLDLSRVYVFRSEYLATASKVMGYFMNWQAHVINVGVLLFGHCLGSVRFMLVAILMQVALFGMTGFKSFLFSIPFALVIARLSRNRGFLLYAVVGASMLVVGGLLFFAITTDILLPSLAIRRTLFVPAQLHFWYNEFFMNNPKIYLSNSIFRLFVKYPYNMPVTRVISWAFMGRDGGPNVGLLGDAYANFGYAGMIVYTILLALFLRLIDSIASSLPRGYATAMIAMPAFCLTNSALFTTLMTHGFLLSALWMWFSAGELINRSGGFGYDGGNSNAR